MQTQVMKLQWMLYYEQYECWWVMMDPSRVDFSKQSLACCVSVWYMRMGERKNLRNSLFVYNSADSVGFMNVCVSPPNEFHCSCACFHSKLLIRAARAPHASNNTRRNKFENNGYKWPKTEEFPKVKYIASKLHFWFHLNIAHAHATACQSLVSS